MAITENTFTGNGSTTNYPFTFPYIKEDDVKVSLDGVVTTAYTFANATTIQFNTAPASGVAIRIYRETGDENLAAVFYSGSAIRSNDLNDNFTQALYVAQETKNIAETTEANVSQGVADAALALTNSQTAISTANTANATATTADTNASAAVATANTASATATTAINTANTANTNASAAVSTANTASTNASNAATIANTANTNASQALSLVSAVVDYPIIANVAAIPGSPANGDGVEVLDSTGIESFTPLTGVPSRFTGSSALRVKIKYTTTGSTWEWVAYSPVDPESRYGSKAVLTQVESDLTQAQSDIIGLDSSKLDVTTAASTYLTQANAASTYLTQANAASTYLTQANAASTYLTQANATSTYLTQANAASTYLTQANATSTYLTQADATSTYLTQSAASSTYLSQASATSTYLTQANAASTYQANHTNTTTAVNKTLVANERCTVTAAGITVTLPASPTQGDEVTIIVGGAFTNTVVGRNGSNIMSLAQDLTIDRENVSITLLYVDATRGWRII